MHTTLQALALIFAALATGGLFVNWIGLARAMRDLTSASAYVEFHQATNRTFDPYMPIVVVGALASNLALGVYEGGVVKPTIAASLYAAVLVLSLTTNVRLNKAIGSWSVSSPPADWSAVRERWIRYHIVRTLVSAPALLAIVLAVISV